jgi:hypothetical protein
MTPENRLLCSRNRAIAMPKPIDHWEWNDPTFAEWRHAVNARLKNVYLITIEDAGIDEQDLRSRWKRKEPPHNYVDWFALKYDLDLKSAFGL